jgi:hypothetical protein
MEAGPSTSSHGRPGQAGQAIGNGGQNISAKSAVSAISPPFPVPARRSFASRVQIGDASAPSARRQTGQWLCLTHYSLAKVPLVIQRPCPLAGPASRRAGRWYFPSCQRPLNQEDALSAPYLHNADVSRGGAANARVESAGARPCRAVVVRQRWCEFLVPQ